ncbi:MAG: hypothetical protein WBZ29_03495 [Methanocella sp.]
MSIIKRHLYSILNAKTSRRYALQEDEEEALLSSFREISCQVHEEAGRVILPYELGEPFLVDYEPMFESPFVKKSGTAYYVSYITRLLVSARKLIQSVTDMFGRQESILQQQEEMALFGTMEEVSRTVRQEAAECGIFLKGEGIQFAAAYEKPFEEEPAPARSPVIKDALFEMVHWRNTQKMARQPWAIIDMYSSFMEEELTFIGHIMDRNKAVKQAYVKAHPAGF